MEINDFIKKFADQFEDTDASEIKAETKFRELEEWSSMTGLSVLNMVDKAYGVSLTFDELRNANTVLDLFNTIAKK